jgi:hypothetical protein
MPFFCLTNGGGYLEKKISEIINERLNLTTEEEKLHEK